MGTGGQGHFWARQAMELLQSWSETGFGTQVQEHLGLEGWASRGEGG